MKVRRHSLLFIATAACTLPLVPGQFAGQSDQPKVAIEPRARPERSSAAPNVRIDSLLVLIPVMVTDSVNRFVPGLKKDNFRLFEDKVEQSIRYFGSEDAPVSVGLVFDISGSMAAELGTSRRAVAQLVQRSNTEDEFFLLEFHDHPKVVVPFTADTGDIQSRLTFMNGNGRTALLDALVTAMQYSKRNAAHARKALVVFSDGGDNHSRYSESEVRNLVRESDIQIYALGIFDPNRGPGPEDRFGPALLNDIASQTGGRFFRIRQIQDLPEVAARIGTELRSQYVLGYRPMDTERSGKYRRVRVKLTPPAGSPALHVSWRPGYYAPAK